MWKGPDEAESVPAAPPVPATEPRIEMEACEYDKAICPGIRNAVWRLRLCVMESAFRSVRTGCSGAGNSGAVFTMT